MELLNNLLLKYQKLASNREIEVGVVKKTIFNLTGVDLEIKNIEIKKGLIYIKSSPLLKGEIFIHKKDIIKELNNNNFSSGPIVDVK